ncbi:RNA 2',3'-cyclic phosphodiesterase [Chloroflexota bacterium]
MEQIRSFIAIELPDRLKQELGQLEARLKSGNQSWVKWANPDSIHLTLKFLGNIAQDRSGEITRVMEEVAKAVPPFHLEVKDLGAFPNLKRVQVVWAGICGEVDKLGKLHQGIESNLERLGFAPETRPFKSHLTLARLRDHASPDERLRLGQLISETRFQAGSFEVDNISLMRSKLTRGGAIYSRISLVALNKSLVPESRS